MTRRTPDTAPSRTRRGAVVEALASAGCVAAAAEADELIRAGRDGVGRLESLVARRVRGEPLAWITGAVEFCGVRVAVDRGVFVPRPHTQPLARRAADLLPDGGVALDLCTGSGAIAVVMRARRPRATIVATDVDSRAVACARRNGIDAHLGDLDAAVPPSLGGAIDVLTAVAPYVPTEAIGLLPRDVQRHEPRRALDGGPRGTDALVRVVRLAPRWLRPGGTALLELGGDQANDLAPLLVAAGLVDIRVHVDGDGLPRAVEARQLE